MSQLRSKLGSTLADLSKATESLLKYVQQKEDGIDVEKEYEKQTHDIGGMVSEVSNHCQVPTDFYVQDAFEMKTLSTKLWNCSILMKDRTTSAFLPAAQLRQHACALLVIVNYKLQGVDIYRRLFDMHVRTANALWFCRSQLGARGVTTVRNMFRTAETYWMKARHELKESEGDTLNFKDDTKALFELYRGQFRIAFTYEGAEAPESANLIDKLIHLDLDAGLIQDLCIELHNCTIRLLDGKEYKVATRYSQRALMILCQGDLHPTNMRDLAAKLVSLVTQAALLAESEMELKKTMELLRTDCLCNWISPGARMKWLLLLNAKFGAGRTGDLRSVVEECLPRNGDPVHERDIEGYSEAGKWLLEEGFFECSNLIISFLDGCLSNPVGQAWSSKAKVAVKLLRLQALIREQSDQTMVVSISTRNKADALIKDIVEEYEMDEDTIYTMCCHLWEWAKGLSLNGLNDDALLVMSLSDTLLAIDTPNPRLIMALRANMATIFASMGRYEDGIGEILKIPTGLGDSPDVVLTHIKCLVGLGKEEEAKQMVSELMLVDVIDDTEKQAMYESVLQWTVQRKLYPLFVGFVSEMCGIRGLQLTRKLLYLRVALTHLSGIVDLINLDETLSSVVTEAERVP
eukprot:Clim_evm69s33 gene=Clim_evmTU69s33